MHHQRPSVEWRKSHSFQRDCQRLGAAVLVATAAGQSTAPDCRSAAGLSALEGDQRLAARRLVIALLAQNKKSDTLTTSADKYMQRKGFIKLYLSLHQVDRKLYLVVKDDFSQYATSDLPTLMSSSLFKNGEYYAKPNIIGGISEYIDQDGRAQSLLFSEWKRLK